MMDCSSLLRGGLSRPAGLVPAFTLFMLADGTAVENIPDRAPHKSFHQRAPAGQHTLQFYHRRSNTCIDGPDFSQGDQSL